MNQLFGICVAFTLYLVRPVDDIGKLVRAGDGDGDTAVDDLAGVHPRGTVGPRWIVRSWLLDWIAPRIWESTSDLVRRTAET